MKRFLTLFSLLVVFTITTAQAQCSKSCSAAKCPGAKASVTETASAKDNKELKIEAYYFHYTRRCATCQAIEQVSADALKAMYGNNVEFKSVNLDEKINDDLAKKLGVDGQALLIIKGDRKVDLTNDGFMYAKSDPDKLKSKLRSAVDSMK